MSQPHTKNHLRLDHLIFITVDFGVPFDTHQLSINEDTRAFIHSSNIEECAKASANLNCVNIFWEMVPQNPFLYTHNPKN
jgi:L-cystine uptake protein TcyP (sodium:dicarboxylate symporter family)